jgi:DNA-binding transcriptional regulator GbsR (MarR family)
VPDAKSGQSEATKLVTESQDAFIAAWGQMGSAWGISRTMAEVHALLYITGEALCTDDVIDRLQISRGNASMSLRALQDWGLVTRTHKRGDRKEYFECESDVWAMFKTIARERKKRELDPVLASLYEIRDRTGVEFENKSKSAAPSNGKPSADDKQLLDQHNKRLDAMLDFMSTVEKLGQIMVAVEGAGMKLATNLIEKFGD